MNTLIMNALPGTDAVKVGMGGNSPLGRMKDHADHFQGLLGDVIRKEKPDVMIETGVESGYSSEHYLVAMDDNKKGKLYSCDPAPTGFYKAYPIKHPRFVLIEKASYVALDEILKVEGKCDMFVHDSDHSYACQTFEYEWAWKNVRSGGVIASDDIGWSDTTPDKPHHAWSQFLERHGLAGKDVKINNAAWVRRP
jgi:predicted O-methyltransferase YrrM